MNTSSKHVQFSVLAGLVTVFGLTVGFAGAESASLPSIASSFVLSTSNGITSGAFADAKFDIAGYMSHPCYQISGTEVESCNYNYGITEPLKTYIDNGMLLSWLGSNNLLAAATPTPVVEEAVTTVETSTVSTEPAATVTMTMEPDVTTLNSAITTEADFATLRLARSNKLWNICIRNDASREMASSCYQQNIRLLMRLDTEINESTVQ